MARWTLLVTVVILLACRSGVSDDKPDGSLRLPLPKPTTSGKMSLEQTLAARRSVRAFSKIPLDLSQVGQLLWSAQGVTRAVTGFRTTPSAGALYPLEVLVAVGNVNDLPGGVYRYQPADHGLRLVSGQDVRGAIARAALNQSWLTSAPVVFVITGVPKRTQRKYGSRAMRYVTMEAGNASQNLLLQAVALGLGGGIIGAFDDRALSGVLHLGDGEQALVVLPVGTPG